MQNYKLLREYKNISVKKCSNASASYHKQNITKRLQGVFILPQSVYADLIQLIITHF